jgi:hypothetical protein
MGIGEWWSEVGCYIMKTSGEIIRALVLHHDGLLNKLFKRCARNTIVHNVKNPIQNRHSNPTYFPSPCSIFRPSSNLALPAKLRYANE